MDRRSFVQSMAGVGMLAAQGVPARAQESGRKPRFFRLDYFSFHQGDQSTRLNEFLTATVPVVAKHIQPVGVFTAVFTSHTQTTLVLTGYSSLAEMETVSRTVSEDPTYRKAHEEFERNPEGSYDTLSRVLLQATDFSPEIVPLAEKPKSPRYFEMRYYHSPTSRQLGLVHDRFAKSTLPIFNRFGIHPLLFADTIIGSDMPSLFYIIPFNTLADREKAWDGFNADPEWIKVRADTVARGGQIVNVTNIAMWRATAYSPLS
jgi:hypothetical protein